MRAHRLFALALVGGLGGCATLPETETTVEVCDDAVNPDCAPDTEIEVIDE